MATQHVICRCCKQRRPLPLGRAAGYGPLADLCKACWDDPANKMSECRHGG